MFSGKLYFIIDVFEVIEMQHVLLKMVIGGKSIVIEAYPEYTPKAIESICRLADAKGYEHLAIQRIVPDFVLQPWYDEVNMDERYQQLLESECAINGYPQLSYQKYAVGMAGDGQGKSAGGCFFIALDNYERLQGIYPVIGYVIEGKEEIDRLMKVELVDVACDEAVVKQPKYPEVIEALTYEMIEVGVC